MVGVAMSYKDVLLKQIKDVNLELDRRISMGRVEKMEVNIACVDADDLEASEEMMADLEYIEADAFLSKMIIQSANNNKLFKIT